MSAVLPPVDEGSFSRLREKAGDDEGSLSAAGPHPSPLRKREREWNCPPSEHS
jgi:hypothetical protein